MDSLTQIVLGAAAGEAVLGKKIGNRAMVWGAVGGTIPDLDVLGGLFLSEIDNLAFHRGISHSILFSIIGAGIFGYIIHHIYQSAYHRYVAIFFKIVAAVLVGFALDFVLSRFFPGNYLPTAIATLGIGLLLYGNIKRNYFKDSWEAPEATLRDWQWLFFWSLITHPILDCFTIYGTQLLAPFSNMRIAWSTISVVDPLYTIPFLVCLLVASRFAKSNRKRRAWNYAGIMISSSYLLFTVVNKVHVNKTFSKAFEQQNIQVDRFITGPFILNNIAWNCTAESTNHFYLGQYSLFDKVDVEFTEIEKNHHLLNNLDSDRTLSILQWFSKDYFSVNQLEDGVQFNDLRFGTFSENLNNGNNFVFKFILKKKDDQYHLEEVVAGPPDGSQKEIMSNLWERIKGRKF